MSFEQINDDELMMMMMMMMMAAMHWRSQITVISLRPFSYAVWDKQRTFALLQQSPLPRTYDFPPYKL